MPLKISDFKNIDTKNPTEYKEKNTFVDFDDFVDLNDLAIQPPIQNNYNELKKIAEIAQEYIKIKYKSNKDIYSTTPDTTPSKYKIHLSFEEYRAFFIVAGSHKHISQCTIQDFIEDLCITKKMPQDHQELIAAIDCCLLLGDLFKGQTEYINKNILNLINPKYIAPEISLAILSAFGYNNKEDAYKELYLKIKIHFLDIYSSEKVNSLLKGFWVKEE